MKFKNNFIGYFKFYYSVLGYRLLINFALCVLISFLDGIGLAMFMPLLKAVSDGPSAANEETMGGLHYITDAIQFLGFEITIDTVLAVLVILFATKGLLKFLQLNYQVNLRHAFLRKIRLNLLSHLQNLSYQGFLKLDVGRIQNTLTTETGRLYQGMNAYFNAMQGVVMLLTYIFLAFLANYQFAILVAIGAAISNFIYRKIYKITKTISLKLTENASSFNGFLVQAIFNFKYLKSTNYFEKFAHKLKTIIFDSEALNQKTGYYNSITSSSKEPIIIIIVVVVIEFQIKVLGSGLSTILLSLLLFYRALNFLVVIQTHWQLFVQNIGSMNAVGTLLDEMNVMKEKQGEKSFSSIEKGITVRNADFTYGVTNVLSNLSMIIPKNHTIALVGESGSGKTTLANMLAGLIRPNNGDVLIDETSLYDFDLNSYRIKIGFISQDPAIFNDTLFNNITFWGDHNDVNVKRFWEVIELASLTEFVFSLPEKENTILGDNGILISGGQKQRVSIARELYKDAQLLILDEATSALDTETEKIIQENIEKLHGNYTMVIIAHRLSTIKNADTIYLLENGSVSASGDFTQMLSISTRFKRMVTLQEFNV